MFSTSLGPNDLIQINLNHWGEKKILKLYIWQDIKAIFSKGFVIAWLKFLYDFFLLHCTCIILLKCNGTDHIGYAKVFMPKGERFLHSLTHKILIFCSRQKERKDWQSQIPANPWRNYRQDWEEKIGIKVMFFSLAIVMESCFKHSNVETGQPWVVSTYIYPNGSKVLHLLLRYISSSYTFVGNSWRSLEVRSAFLHQHAERVSKLFICRAGPLLGKQKESAV